MTELLNKLKEKALLGKGISTDEALKITVLPGNEIFSILSITEEVRRKFKGIEVNLCGIVSAKSGLCKEDCSFCSQSVKYTTDIEEFPMESAEKIVEKAIEAKDNGAREFSIVASGTAIEKESDVDTLKDAIRGIKDSTELESCASLGTIGSKTMEQLKSAGLESYHHNLETSRSFFPEVCTTHAYDDDVNTVKRAKDTGFYVCSGGIFGLGESWAQRIELFTTLKELDVDCVPINFLNPRPGTPLEEAENLTPIECLKIIATARLMMPKKDLIVCGGREVNLRDMQALIFAAGANGMMVGNYLTTKGRSTEEDQAMLKDLGLKPKGAHK
ncbi:MAG: biotin synthase BioB [Deltaproteobacteria bacterium]|nr:biotin synthase BioB [Deltaproteobacteria bacterium]